MMEQNRSTQIERQQRMDTQHIYSCHNNSSAGLEHPRHPTFANSPSARRLIEKLSPHYANYQEMYERLQENGRIIKRITNPKRDKLIQKSIESIKALSKPGTQEQRRPARTEYRTRKGTWSTKLGDKHLSVNASQEKYERKMQNERMGKRIINARPMVQTIFTEHISPRPRFYQPSKINEGVKAFFCSEDDTLTREQAKQNLSLSRLRTYYGFGPTILSLNKMVINVNPPLKPHELVYLELMTKSTNKKLYTTELMPYGALMDSEIKFALRIKKIGQYVPLRIWKVHGVNNIEVGIVDIQFSKYLHAEQQIRDVRTAGGGGQCRVAEPAQPEPMSAFVEDAIQCKLRKTKIEEAQGSIMLQYLIYRKKYL